ncbi:MAG: HK97 family phage prohead protease [Roseivirga sp.]|nr:HK97 family phage prohead protease [Roseivirga sp.]
MSNPKDYIEKIEGAERRFFLAPVTVELRADDEDKPAVIEGYAGLFNKRTDMGWYEEEILPGFFDDVLDDDVRCLFNHNPNYILARSVKGKGTLTLTIDKKGLKYRYETPDRSYAKDLADAIDKGDVSQSSFAFRASETVWIERGEGEKDLRQLKKAERLYDVSPVTYAAYNDTTVAKRSFDSREEEETETQGAVFDDFNARYLINENSN